MTEAIGPPRIEFAWGWHEARLRAARSYWIVTHRPDGRPHAAPVWGVWRSGELWFSTAATSVKASNLAVDARVVVHLDSADDLLMLEGTARTADPGELGAVDAAYRDKYRLTDGSAVGLGGPSPVFAVTPRVGHTWLEPAFAQTMTRWAFGAPGTEPTAEANHYG